jgi:hypothetical protein
MDAVMVVLNDTTRVHHHNKSGTVVKLLQYVCNEAVSTTLVLSEIASKGSQVLNCLLDVEA